MSKHTPGPWRVVEIPTGKRGAGGGSFIMPTIGPNPVVVSVRNLDDARLIAAAPDLLEACKAAALTLNINRRLVSCPELKAKLDAAIAKAECNE